jgi:putative nucleotidyltransferase with HDIG domain
MRVGRAWTRTESERLASATLDDAAAALAQEVRVLFRSSDYRPPMLPTVALEVQRAVSMPVTTFADVARILEKDPLLTGQVLRLAQSPVFSRGASVHSIREAVGRIGLKNVVDLVWQAAVDMTFRSIRYGRPMEQVRRHGVAIAHVSRVAALATTVPVEAAFLAGLLHDIGLSAALIALGERKGSIPVRWEIEAAGIASAHEELSAIVAKSWNLPEDVQMAIGQHHRLAIRELAHPIAATVYIAEYLAQELGGPTGPHAPQWEPCERDHLAQACAVLRMTPAQLTIVESEAYKVLTSLERA